MIRPGVEDVARRLLERRGVDLNDLAGLVYELQSPYLPTLTHEECLHHLKLVLRKREVQYAVITGITLDEMAEEGTLKEPLGSIVRENSRLFAVDAVLALCIVNVYGSIGLSNFGYLCEDPPEPLRRLDRSGRVNTFLNDLAAAIVAATCARIAHNSRRPEPSEGGAGTSS